MRRRVFLLGMGGVVFSACTGTTRVEPARNPYVGSAPAGPRPPAPPRPAAPSVARGPCAPPPAAPGSGGVHYRVAAGDTLASIARRSGAGVEAIRRANGLRGHDVEAGRLLWLPGGRALDGAGLVAPPDPCAPAARRPHYRLVQRRDWGARALRANHDPMRGIRRITLHHTDEVPGLTGGDDRDVVAAIQRYHQDTMGWADIGYHYLVGRDGRVYEGRVATAQGAHSGGANNIQNLGIAMVGNFSRQMPNGAQMRALESFLADQRAAHGVAARDVLGHRDFGPTECPGGRFYRWLDRYKAGAPS